MPADVMGSETPYLVFAKLKSLMGEKEKNNWAYFGHKLTKVDVSADLSTEQSSMNQGLSSFGRSNRGNLTVD